jgi:hypothetical protein
VIRNHLQGPGSEKVNKVRAVEWKRPLKEYWPHVLIVLTILATVWMYFAFAPEAN